VRRIPPAPCRTHRCPAVPTGDRGGPQAWWDGQGSPGRSPRPAAPAVLRSWPGRLALAGVLADTLTDGDYP